MICKRRGCGHWTGLPHGYCRHCLRRRGVLTILLAKAQRAIRMASL